MRRIGFGDVRRAVHGWLGDGDPPWQAWRSRRVYLTVDGGPDPEDTPRMLDELARLGLYASFFVLGERARVHSALVRRLLAEGHDVELQGMHDVRHTAATRDELERDLDEALAVLIESGARPRWLRPPGGIAEAWSADLAAGRGLRLLGASAGGPEPRPGRIVVLGGPASLEPLAAAIRAKRLRPAPLGDGPAVWRTRTMPADPADPIEVVDEDGLAAGDRAEVCALLAREMSRFTDDYATKGWRRLRPEFRVLARGHSGDVIATTSMMVLENDGGVLLYGSGDSTVGREHRGRRLGHAILREAERECRRRGADAMLGDTTAFAALFQDEGWRRVPRFAIYYERDGACHWHPQWWVWERAPLPERLRISEGDF